MIFCQPDENNHENSLEITKVNEHVPLMQPIVVDVELDCELPKLIHFPVPKNIKQIKQYLFKIQTK